MGRNGQAETIRLSITPTANRNSYRVARLVEAVTQGSVLCPQPWAGESQLHYLSASHCAAPVTFGSELLLLAEAPPRALPRWRERIITYWATDMTHVMLFLAITCSAVGVAARLQTVIPTLAIIIAGSYHLIRGLVPYDT